MYKADLHIHTTASDGKLSPTRVVEEALERDINIIAITDHDTIAGVEEARLRAEGENLFVMQGVEISTIFQDRECHLLAYAFKNPSLISELLGNQKKKRIQRARSIIQNLNKLGFDISFDDVIGEAGKASIGRPHIARVMIRKGYAADMQEVFFRYLGNNSSAYHKIDYPTIETAISKVHEAGGYAILAHPGKLYTYIQLKELKNLGLDGIECYHPSHNSAQQRKYSDYCQNYDLIETGGSDFHGSAADHYRMGLIHCKMDTDHPFLQTQGVYTFSQTEKKTETV